MTYAKHLEQVKARQHRHVAQGLCRFCGSPPRSGISKRTGRGYTTCQRCYEKTNANHKRYRERKRTDKPSPLPPIDSTSDKIYYLVIETGEIGQLVPCPSTDPIILEFKDGIRDAFHLRELEPTLTPSSNSKGRGVTPAKRHGNSRPKGLPQQTIDKMLAVYRFLQKQSSPVYRIKIQETVRFNCARVLMHQPSQLKRDSLESMGIVKRTKGYRTWALWELTQRGRKQGKELILNLNVH